MKTISINVYSHNELNDKAKQKANNYYFEHCFYSDSSDFDGVFRILEYFGIDKRDLSRNYDYINKYNAIFDLIIGKRAFSYFENNLFSKLRISYYSKKRWEYSKYGNAYLSCKIPPCPFTGICYDDDYLDCIYKSLREMNNSVIEVLNGLLELRKKLIKEDEEYRSTQEYISEWFNINEYSFLEDGSICR